MSRKLKKVARMDKKIDNKLVACVIALFDQRNQITKQM